MKTNYLIALFLIANLFDDGISIVYNSSLNPTVETSNKPESDLDDDTNDGGTTIYKQDVELTENDIKNCRLTFHSNDNCPAGRPLSNPNTKIYIGAGWIRISAILGN